MIVSHDSGFLDNVCTDIIHYENRKLVHYRGNLSEFVKVRCSLRSLRKPSVLFWCHAVFVLYAAAGTPQPLREAFTSC